MQVLPLRLPRGRIHFEWITFDYLGQHTTRHQEDLPFHATRALVFKTSPSNLFRHGAFLTNDTTRTCTSTLKSTRFLNELVYYSDIVPWCMTQKSNLPVVITH